MPVLILADHADGRFKRTTYEVLSYGCKLAEQNGTAACALVLGNVDDDIALPGRYGVTKVYHIQGSSFNTFDAQVFSAAIADAVTATGSDVLVLSHNSTGRAVSGLVSAKLKAALVTAAVSLPDTAAGFVVKRSVFSGKAFAHVQMNTAIKIITLNANAYKPVVTGSAATVETLSISAVQSKIKVLSTNKIKGEVPLTEASRVVSGGRGLRGPENWGIVEDLAKELDAALACSRPVADAHWRPHHEHVGQTGITIAPNLYVAAGISGAIQHLAGVNRSKVIVVINKDPEAPFFKAADYGVVGDVFDVLPRLTEELKKFKNDG